MSRWARHVLGPSRPLPRVGARVRIKHFGGDAQEGTIVAVEDDGRRVRVRASGAPPGTRGEARAAPSIEGEADASPGIEDEELEFVLSPKTARFVAAGDPHGPRLELLG